MVGILRQRIKLVTTTLVILIHTKSGAHLGDNNLNHYGALQRDDWGSEHVARNGLIGFYEDPSSARRGPAPCVANRQHTGSEYFRWQVRHATTAPSTHASSDGNTRIQNIPFAISGRISRSPEFVNNALYRCQHATNRSTIADSTSKHAHTSVTDLESPHN